MTKGKKIVLNSIKLVVLVLSIYFLTDKFLRFEYWEELKNSFSTINISRLLFLSFVVLLMPLNWFLETKKWQKLTSKLYHLPFFIALKSVLSGISTGYVTPNRIGEFAGRVLFLPKEKRSTGVLLSLMNGITQNMIITFLGISSAFFYLSKYQQLIDIKYLYYAITLLLIITIIYFSIPYFTQNKRVRHWNKKTKISHLINSLALLTKKDLFIILLISTFRFVIFSCQFWLTLSFFGINLTFLQAIISIPTLYLLITYTPSFAFSEPFIRGGYAVFIIGIFSNNHIGIALTGILIWIINFVIPLLFGLLILLKKR